MPLLLLLAFDLQLTVLVHDFVSLSPSVRKDTRHHLASILQSASVDLVWVDCRASGRMMNLERCEALRPGDVLLRFVGSGQTRPAALDLEMLGYTDPGWAGQGLITMWPAPVAEMRRGTHWQLPDLFACAIAHEIGHLLGLKDHANAGLMSTNWAKTRLRQMTSHGLTFTSSDIATIRQTLLRRLTPRQTVAAIPPDVR